MGLRLSTILVLVLLLSAYSAEAHHDEPHHRRTDCVDTPVAVNPWDERLLPLPAELTPTARHAITDQRQRFHVAVASSTTRAGSSRTGGGLYVLTSRSGDRWDRTATVFCNNEHAVAHSPFMATNDRQCSHTYLHIYLVFCVDVTRDDQSQFTELMYARSVDGGNTFSPPFRLDIHGDIPASPMVLVDHEDHVTVQWTDARDGHTFARTSHDGDPDFTRQQPPEQEEE
jgi:hypothetical protein